MSAEFHHTIIQIGQKRVGTRLRRTYIKRSFLDKRLVEEGELLPLEHVRSGVWVCQLN
jgi:hypothetical protein